MRRANLPIDLSRHQQEWQPPVLLRRDLRDCDPCPSLSSAAGLGGLTSYTRGKSAVASSPLGLLVTDIASFANAPKLAAELELIGPVVRLQVQTSSLKRGERPQSWYDPGPILSVPSLRLDDGGVTGVDECDIADVHHRDHPQTKFRGENGVSIGFTGHYARMRARFGEHLSDGVAGENILVDAAGRFTETDVMHGVVIVGAGGHTALSAVEAATPCVEFSKFCAGYARTQRPDIAIADTLRFLIQGTRGFYVTLEGESGTAPAIVALGDLVFRRLG